MAKKFSELPAASAPADSDLLAATQSGSTVKMTIAQIKTMVDGLIGYALGLLGTASAYDVGSAIDELPTNEDVANALEELNLGTFATADYAAAPFINVMPDSGRFAGKINPLKQTITENFVPSGFFSPYNGAATFTEAGKFIHNNTTFGGSAGTLTEPVEALLLAAGRLGVTARYGIEFYVSTTTAGSGTANPHDGTDSVTRYLSTVNLSRNLFASGGFGTVAMWVRVTDGSAHIPFPYYLNGSLVAAGTPLPAGFNHVRGTSQIATGYNNGFPGLYSVPGSVIDIALPAFFTGAVDTGIHSAPIPTINELNA